VINDKHEGAKETQNFCFCTTIRQRLVFYARFSVATFSKTLAEAQSAKRASSCFINPLRSLRLREENSLFVLVAALLREAFLTVLRNMLHF